MLVKDGSARLSISARLREERLRLGLSQTAFAALAGVTKSAQIKWEGGASSAPTAPALAAMVAGGVDVLYVLSGRRTASEPADFAATVAAKLKVISRDILEPDPRPVPGESADDADRRIVAGHAKSLRDILGNDAPLLPSELVDEAEHLLDIAGSWGSLMLNRAHAHSQRRSRRRDVREQIAGWLGERLPRDGVVTLLVTLAIEHQVPMRLLVELVEEMREDLAERGASSVSDTLG